MFAARLAWWCALLVVTYTYIIYPVLIGVAARIRARRRRREIVKDRSFSVVMTAFNEEASIERRLQEISGRVETSPLCDEIIVVSDGSTDNTASYARGISSTKILVIDLPENVGKAEALNIGCAAARGEILVFGDVRQTWAEDTVEHLLENFSDPTIGAVSGALVLESAPGVMAGVGLYWRFEKWLRRQESLVHSTVGVSGSISAVRRELFQRIPKGTILDDVNWPMQVVMRGFRVVQDESAKAFDRLPDRPRDEFRRKVRTLSGNYQMITLLPALLLPWRNPIWLQFLSHKLCRLIVPWALLVLLISGGILQGPFYGFLFWCQMVFFLLAVVGARGGVGSRVPLGSFATSFLILNAAAWLAFWVWVTGRASRSWKKATYSAVSGETPRSWRPRAEPRNPKGMVRNVLSRFNALGRWGDVSERSPEASR